MVRVRAVELSAILTAVGLGVLAAIWGGLGCTSKNPEFCCLTAESCAPFGVAPTNCPEPSNQACVDNRCVQETEQLCDPNAAAPECPASNPVCDTSGICVDCSLPADCDRFADTKVCHSVTHACVGCETSSTCGDGVCDATTALCRPCTVGSECGSEVCQAGGCVDQAKIIYVEQAGGSIANGCDQEHPCSDLAMALTLVSPIRNLVLIKGGVYAPPSTLELDVNVSIIGGSSRPSITVATTSLPVLSVGNGAVVVLEHLEVQGSQVDGINCSSGGGTKPSLTIRNSRIASNGGQGIDANACDLAIDRSVVEDNDGGGVILIDGTPRITSSFFVDNGGASSNTGGVEMINIPSTAGAIFHFNSVVGNLAGSGAAGMDCSGPGALVASSNLVANNLVGGSPVNAGSCNWDFSCLEGVTATASNVNVTLSSLMLTNATNDPHLNPGSSASGVGDPAIAPAIDLDGDPRPNPAGSNPDCGADEL